MPENVDGILKTIFYIIVWFVLSAKYNITNNITVNSWQGAQRMEAAGKQFVFGQQETREIGQLDRAQSLLENAQAQQMASRGQGIGALVSGLNTLANVEDLGSVFGGDSSASSDGVVRVGNQRSNTGNF